MSSYIFYKTSISKIFDFPRRQQFSLPSSIIFYVSKNPISADGLQKLQKTCKYFFAKNQVIVVYDKMDLYPGKDGYFFYQLKNQKGNYVHFYFNEIKFWLTENLVCQYGISKNIYRCTLEALVIQNQTLKFSELDFLLNGGNIKSLDLREVDIRDDENGTIVSCDKVLAKVPNIECFIYINKNEIFSNETFEKMNLLEFRSKLYQFMIKIPHLSQTEDLKLLCKFLRKNMAKDSHVHIDFVMANSEDYFHIFKTMVNEDLLPWMKENKTVMSIFSQNQNFAFIG